MHSQCRMHPLGSISTIRPEVGHLTASPKTGRGTKNDLTPRPVSFLRIYSFTNLITACWVVLRRKVVIFIR